MHNLLEDIDNKIDKCSKSVMNEVCKFISWFCYLLPA